MQRYEAIRVLMEHRISKMDAERILDYASFTQAATHLRNAAPMNLSLMEVRAVLGLALLNNNAATWEEIGLALKRLPRT